MNCQNFITFATSNDKLVHMLICISRITNNMKFYIINIIIQPDFRLSKNFTPDRKRNINRSCACVRYCEVCSLVKYFWYSKILIFLYLLWYELYYSYMSEWVLLNVKWANLQLHHCELFNKMMMMSALYQTKTDVLLITTWLQKGHVYTV